MKKLLFSLIALLAIFSSAHATEVSKSEAAAATGANVKGSCSNHNTYSECPIVWFEHECAECKKKCKTIRYESSYSSPNECDNQESTTSGDIYSPGSVIDNRSFNFIHIASDYTDSSVENTPLCSSCGDNSPGQTAGSSAPKLGFIRFHRYRNVSEIGSLGNAFCNWDLNLTLFKDSNSNNRVDIADPNDLSTRRLFPQSGKFYDTYGRSYDGLTLYKEDGTTTTTNIDLADTGILKTKTGRFFHFEIFVLDEFTKMGRLKKIVDRNDYGIEITYEITDYRADETTVPDPLSKFRMASISDSTNRTLTFTYLTDGSGAFTKRSGSYPIKTMTVPNGSVITYNYGPTLDSGLISVDYPDGTQTTITTDTDSGRTRVHFFEASEDHNNKRKSVYLTNNFVSNPTKDGIDYYNSAALLIDFATRGAVNTTENPDSEKVTYAGMVDGHIMHRKVYEAGGVLKWIDIDVARYYSSWSLSGDPATGAAAFTGTQESTYNHGQYWHYAGNRQGRPPVKFDDKGVKYTMVYNGNGSITRKNYSDGTFESWSYNQFEQPVRYRDRLARTTLKHYDDRGNHLLSIVGLKSESIAQGSQRISGLFYNLYDGTFNILPDFASLTPVDYGVTPSYEIDGTDRDEKYAMTFEGDVDIQTAGDYVFTTGSDDGSKLYIDDVLVVDNDGLHGLTEVDSVPVTLTAGYHKIRIEFFEKSGQQKLFVYYNGPDSGNVKTLIPQTALSHLATGMTEQDVIQPETAVIVKEYYPEGHANQFLLKYNFDAVLFPTGQSLTDYAGLISHISSTNNKRTEYQYNSDNQLVEIIEPDDTGNGYHTAWSFRYDSAKRLWKSIDAGSVFTNLPATDPNRRTTENSYDSRDRLIQKTYSDGSTETFTFGSGENANQVIEHKDRNGNITKTTYDELGRKLTVTKGFGSTAPSLTTYEYLSDSKYITAVVKNGNRTEYSYDYRLRRVEESVIADNDSTLVTTQVYKDNKLFCKIDPYGRKSYYYYRSSDSVLLRKIQGNYPSYSLSSFADVANEVRDFNNNSAYIVTDYTVDVAGQTTELIDGRGIKEVGIYNARGWEIKTIKAVGSTEAVTEYDYDAMKNIIEERHPRFFDSTDLEGYQQCATRTTFSRRNKPLSVTEAYYSTLSASRTTTWYNDGKQASSSDFKGKITDLVWKICCGRLGVKAGPTFTDKDGNLKKRANITEYDFYGNETHTAVLSWNANDPLPPCCYPDPIDSTTLQEVTLRYDQRLRPVAQTLWLEPLGYVDPNNVPIGTDTGVTAQGLTTTTLYYDEVNGHSELQPLLNKLSEDGITFTGSTGSAEAKINPAGEVSLRIMDGAGRTVASGMIDKTTWEIGTAGTLVTWNTIIYDNIDPATGLLITELRSALNFSNKRLTDGSDRTIKFIDADGKAYQGFYDNNSNVLVSSDPNSNDLTCTFDDLNRKISCVDARGDTTAVAYNLSNQTIQVTDGKGQTASAKFDARNRPVAETNKNNDTKTKEYDANNRTIAEWDENQIAYSGTDYSKATRYLYDDRSVLVTVALPGHPAGNQADNFIDLSTAASDPAYDLKKQNVDALNRISFLTDQKEDTVTYIHDMASRMTIREYRTGGILESTDEFIYDQASRELSAYKGRYDNSVLYEYDNIGRPVKETLKLGRPEISVAADSYSTQCSFDADNRMISCTYPSGNTVDRTLTGRNQLQSISFNASPVASFLYDDGMRETQRTFNNGVTTTTSYYQDNTKAGITVAGKADLSFSYTHDNNKNVLTETSTGTVMSGYSWTATFDNLDRVKTFTRNNAEYQNWDMDPLGNWASTTGLLDGNNINETRTHNDVNELIAVGSSTLSHDAKGNITENNHGHDYTWDIDNHLQTSYKGSGNGGGIGKGAGNGQPNGLCTYEYDAIGRRVSKKCGNVKTLFVSHGQQVVEEHSSQAGQPYELQRSYVYGSYVDDILAKVEAETTPVIHYYHFDRQHSVRGLTDSAGNTIELYAYTPFGKQTILTPLGVESTESLFDNYYGFTGRYLDKETGLLYFRARYFDNELGRFISRDPLGYVDGMSLYGAYFAERFLTDPFGFESGMGPVAGRTPKYDNSSKIKEAKEDKKKKVQEALNDPKATKCVFNRKARTVTCTDPNGNTETCSTTEQNDKELKDTEVNGPTPKGNYLIGTMRQHNKVDWFNLYREFENKEGFYGYLAKGKDGRTGFGLHEGTISFGCVTVENDNPCRCCWKRLAKIINNGNLKYKGQQFRGVLIVK